MSTGCALAADDRDAAACDRELSARDRVSALADREILARQLAIADADNLAGGAHSGELADLERERDRCQRTRSVLVVACINIASTDESVPHDDLLEGLAWCISTHVRSYDLIVRLSASQLVCALPGATLPVARARFAEVADALAPPAGTLRFGFATLEPDDTAIDLVARADRDGRGAPHEPAGAASSAYSARLPCDSAEHAALDCRARLVRFDPVTDAISVGSSHQVSTLLRPDR